MGKKRISAQERERLWTELQRRKEEAWARTHPGITAYNEVLRGDFSRMPWLQAGGDPEENRAFTDAWGRMGRNRELQAVNAANAEAGNDPYAAGFARIKARIGAGGDYANAFSQFRLGQAQRRSQGLSDIYGQAYRADQDLILQKAQQEAGRRMGHSNLFGSIGGFLGPILAAALMRKPANPSSGNPGATNPYGSG